MDFEYDSDKSQRNEIDRGISFEYAALIFTGPTLETLDDRRDYGEKRWIALGEVDGIELVVVYTDRDDVRRIISARRAGKNERVRWRQFVSRSPKFRPPNSG